MSAKAFSSPALLIARSRILCRAEYFSLEKSRRGLSEEACEFLHEQLLPSLGGASVALGSARQQPLQELEAGDKVVDTARAAGR